MTFYILLMIFGILMLYYSIKTIQSIKKINSYVELADMRVPGTSRKKISNFTKLKNKTIDYFAPVYSRVDGLYVRGFLFLVVVCIAFIIVNHTFLKLNVTIPIILGVVVGNFMVKKIQEVRIKNDFEKNFPEALIVLNGAISSGSNVTQALEYYAYSSEGAISDEFKSIIKSLSIGEDPAKVFANSYYRLPFRNYYFFLIAILVSLKSGAKLKEILSRLGTATSKAKAMERKKLAMTSEARMSAKITAAIPFAFLFLMKFISPENFDYILNDPTGRYVLYYFLASEFIGMAMIMFLMRKL